MQFIKFTQLVIKDNGISHSNIKEKIELTKRAILNCNPNTKFNSLPKNQDTAYVF